MGPFWARLGLLLVAIWEPKSGRVRSKMHLESLCCQKCRSSKNSGKRNVLATFLISGWSLDHLKTGPRRVQERYKKRCIFRLDFSLVLGSSWGRLGVVLGVKTEPKSFPPSALERPGTVWFSIWLLKSVPRGKSQRWPGFRPLQEGFGGGSWAVWGGVLGLLGGLLGAERQRPVAFGPPSPPPCRRCRTRHFPRTSSMG